MCGDEDIGSAMLTLDLGVITANMICRYAKAVGDLDAIHHDRATAVAAGYNDVIAPPNFLPAIIGTPSGINEGDLLFDGLDPIDIPEPLRGRRVMGGGQELSFKQPVQAGTRVACRRKLLDLRTKQTKRGELMIARTEAAYFDQDGTLLLTCVQTMLAI